MALTRKFEGYSENWTEYGGTSTIVYSGPWSTRTADSIIGNKHPDPTISDLLIATSVTIEPWGDASDTGTGGPFTARHTVSYEGKATDVYTLSDWQEQWEIGGEAITIGSGYRWSDTGNYVDGDERAVKLLPTATIGITGTAAFTSAAKTKVLNCVGKVNASAMSIKGHSFAAEHLLFIGLSANEVNSTNYDLAYKIAYRHDITWNEFWREPSNNNKVSPGFAVLIDGGGAKPYLTANFSDIDPKNW